jgi:restriction system protein
MELSNEDRSEMLPSGLKTRCEDRINWSVTYLFQAKLLERPRRGIYHVSERGVELLARGPEKITVSLLSQYPEFVEFNRPKHNNDDSTDPEPDSGAPQTQTPEERLESGFKELNDALATEVLNLVKESSPDFFERLVVRLLVAMGYGGSIQDAGKAVGKAGDGGIDGIIKEDKLGLDNVYLQAKRYTEQTVGSRIVREFIGSLTLRRARKGVLITTSTFSPDATACVSNLDQRIVLIDGRQLAELMIEHSVGVTVAKSYQLKKLDQDFFEGE